MLLGRSLRADLFDEFGRERLLETYGVIRSIMDEATAEVAVAEVEARAAAEAAVVVPALGTELAAGARLFDAVRYGDRAATAADEQAMRHLDDAVRAARPATAGAR